MGEEGERRGRGRRGRGPKGMNGMLDEHVRTQILMQSPTTGPGFCPLHSIQIPYEKSLHSRFQPSLFALNEKFNLP